MMCIFQPCKTIFLLQGIRGFWKGVTASYWGISETMIHFLIYEYLKKKLAEAQNKRKTDDKTFLDFAGFMLCGACSKTCATIVAYPHGKFYKFGNLETYFCWPWRKQSFQLFWICAKNFDFYTTKGRKIELKEKYLRHSKNHQFH